MHSLRRTHHLPHSFPPEKSDQISRLTTSIAIADNTVSPMIGQKLQLGPVGAVGSSPMQILSGSSPRSRSSMSRGTHPLLRLAEGGAFR